MSKREIIDLVREVIGFPPKRDEREEHIDSRDTAYVRSLSVALSQESPSQLQRVVFIICFAALVLILWAAWAKLDTVVRAGGKVIPSGQVQKIQSLEGGVVSEILVKEGDIVSINQPLMKISDIPFLGSFEENRIKLLELRARAARLTAEANSINMIADAEVTAEQPDLMAAELSLFQSNKEGVNKAIKVLDERVKQAESSLDESEARARQMARSLEILRKEIEITRPLVERNIVSQVEFLQLQGRESEALGEYDGLQLSIPRLKSTIAEAKQEIKVTQSEFANTARRELTEVQAEISRINETQITLADRVARTTLRSPVTGVVKQLLNNTVGGVINPGNDVMEIVPSEDSLLVEVKIKPADIGNVEVGLPCRVKFSAYDFAIHGSLSGVLRYLSADTITDQDGVSFYVARVEPDAFFFDVENQLMPVKVGMTTEVDIITGEKTILQSILNPLTRGLDKALKES